MEKIDIELKNIYSHGDISLNGSSCALIKLHLIQHKKELFFIPQYIKKFRRLISESAGKIQDICFISGLAGIGWTIELLSQYSFIKSDVNYILEDLDDVLYRSVIYSNKPNISLNHGSLGLLLYFFYRERSIKDTNRYRKIPIYESIVLLTDDISNKIFSILEQKTLDQKSLGDLVLC